MILFAAFIDSLTQENEVFHLFWQLQISSKNNDKQIKRNDTSNEWKQNINSLANVTSQEFTRESSI